MPLATRNRVAIRFSCIRKTIKLMTARTLNWRFAFQIKHALVKIYAQINRLAFSLVQSEFAATGAFQEPEIDIAIGASAFRQFFVICCTNHRHIVARKNRNLKLGACRCE